MIIGDLPTGSVLVFAFDPFILLRVPRFVITYLLSIAHAVRYGAYAGLGLTFIQYGAYWRSGMQAGTSRAEQQEMDWWNAIMAGIGLDVDSGPDPTATMLLR